MAEAAEDAGKATAADIDLFDDQGQFDETMARIKNSLGFKMKENSLRCPDQDDNSVFKRLRNKILKFHLIQEKVRIEGLSEKQKEEKRITGIDFGYLVKLHKCLFNMLREVVITDDK